MMKRLVTIMIMAGLSVGLWGPSATQAADPTAEFAPGEVVVQYREGTSDAQQRAARGRVNGLSKQTLRRQASGAPGLELLTLPAGANVFAAIATLQNDPSVAFAEPNWLYTTGPVTSATPTSTSTATGTSTAAGFSPDDDCFQRDWMWGMFNGVDSIGRTHSNVFGSQAGQVWNAGRVGDGRIYVGVIDEGIDYTHPDLAANVWTNSADPPGDANRDGYLVLRFAIACQDRPGLVRVGAPCPDRWG